MIKYTGDFGVRIVVVLTSSGIARSLYIKCNRVIEVNHKVCQFDDNCDGYISDIFLNNMKPLSVFMST
jgi:hypothetical protein